MIARPAALARPVSEPRRAATDADFPLWNKEAVPFARDLLFVIGIFAYLIGFANHAAKMAQFGMETQLADQPLTSLFTWAAEAISDGWAGFAVIFVTVTSQLLLAGFLKHRFATNPAFRPVVYGLVTLAICTGLIASFAWSSKVGVCEAERNWVGDKKLAAVLIRVGSQTTIPALTSNSLTPPPAYILAETNDAYQILVTQPSPAWPIPMIVPRSEVLSVEYRQPLANDSRPAVALANNRYPGPRNLPTPDPLLSGAGIAPDRSLTSRVSRLASCYGAPNG